MKGFKKLLEEVKKEGLSNPEQNLQSSEKKTILKSGLSYQEIDDVRQINIKNSLALKQAYEKSWPLIKIQVCKIIGQFLANESLGPQPPTSCVQMFSAKKAVDVLSKLIAKSSKQDVHVYYENENQTIELVRVAPVKSDDRIIEKIKESNEPDIQIQDILRISLILNVLKAKKFLE